MNKIYRVFFDTDLRNGHLGLAKMARDAKIKLEALAPGNFVCFINRTQTSIKLFAPGNVIAYYRSTRRIDLNVIANIPTVFNGSAIAYEKALEKTLTQKLKHYE